MTPAQLRTLADIVHALETAGIQFGADGSVRVGSDSHGA
jgi:hypothetical protein